MRRVVRPFVIAQLALFLLAPGLRSQEHVWSHRYGGIDQDIGAFVAAQDTSYVYVTGIFQGTAGFGGPNLVSAGSDDIFLAKYDATGAHVWSKSFGGTASDAGQSIAIDANGDVLISGTYSSAGVDFGGLSLTHYGGQDAFLAKLDGDDGSHIWSRGFGTAGTDQARSVTVDGANDVLVTGIFSGATSTLGGAVLTYRGDGDAFVAKYQGTDGSHVWSFGHGGPDQDQGNGVGVDADGDVMMIGDFIGSQANFGGGWLPHVGGSDIVIAKYHGNNGQWQWSHGYGSSGNDQGLDIAVDPVNTNCPGDPTTGHTLVTGFFAGSMDLGGGPLPYGGSRDVFVANFGLNGGHIWSRGYGGAGDDQGRRIAVDDVGRVVVTGHFSSGDVDFGGGDLPYGGSTDVFVVELSPFGAHAWSGGYGDAADQLGLGSTFDTAGDILVTGGFPSTVSFSPGNVLTSLGASDVFLARFTTEELSATEIDWDKLAKTAIADGLSEVPEAGPLLSALVDIFWPESGTPPWETILAEIKALLSEQNWKNVNNTLSGLEHLVKDYREAVNDSPPDYESIRTKYWIVKEAFDRSECWFEGAPDQALLLPLFAHFANLRLTLLRDGVLSGESWGFLTSETSDLQNQLTGLIASYQVYAQAVFDGRINELRSTTLEDNSRCEPFLTVNRYTREATLSVMDYVPLWGYLDPSIYPDRVEISDSDWLPREIYSDPQGNQGCGFLEVPQLVLPTPPSQPIRGIEIWAWNYLGAAKVTYSPGGGPGGVTQTEQMNLTPGGSNHPPAGGGFNVLASNPIVHVSGATGELSETCGGHLEPNWSPFAVSQVEFTFADQSTTSNYGGIALPYPFSWSFPDRILSSIYIPEIEYFGDTCQSGVIIFGFKGWQPKFTPPPDPLRRTRYQAHAHGFPNPFNPATTISFLLRDPSPVSLVIYDVQGRKVRTLLDKSMPAGTHHQMWDGTDESGRGVASGVYFYRVSTDDFVETERLVLLK